jgi:prepilin-type processing-associated H-X9-DG protein
VFNSLVKKAQEAPVAVKAITNGAANVVQADGHVTDGAVPVAKTPVPTGAPGLDTNGEPAPAGKQPVTPSLTSNSLAGNLVHRAVNDASTLVHKTGEAIATVPRPGQSFFSTN